MSEDRKNGPDDESDEPRDDEVTSGPDSATGGLPPNDPNDPLSGLIAAMLGGATPDPSALPGLPPDLLANLPPGLLNLPGMPQDPQALQQMLSSVQQLLTTGGETAALTANVSPAQDLRLVLVVGFLAIAVGFVGGIFLTWRGLLPRRQPLTAASQPLDSPQPPSDTPQT